MHQWCIRFSTQLPCQARVLTMWCCLQWTVCSRSGKSAARKSLLFQLPKIVASHTHTHNIFQKAFEGLVSSPTCNKPRQKSMLQVISADDENRELPKKVRPAVNLVLFRLEPVVGFCRNGAVKSLYTWDTMRYSFFVFFCNTSVNEVQQSAEMSRKHRE